MVCWVSGVARTLRPLLWQRTCAPRPRWTSLTVSPVSSETRRPVWMAGDQQQRTVAVGEPAVLAGCGQQRVDLVAGQEAHDGPVAAFGWDVQDRADDGGVLGRTWGRVAEQGAGRGQPGVATWPTMRRCSAFAGSLSWKTTSFRRNLRRWPARISLLRVSPSRESSTAKRTHTLSRPTGSPRQPGPAVVSHSFRPI